MCSPYFESDESTTTVVASSDVEPAAFKTTGSSIRGPASVDDVMDEIDSIVEQAGLTGSDTMNLLVVGTAIKHKVQSALQQGSVPQEVIQRAGSINKLALVVLQIAVVGTQAAINGVGDSTLN